MTDEHSPGRSRSTTLTLRLCRLAILALIALLAATTLYVVALGGVAAASGPTRIVTTEITANDPGAPLPALPGNLPAGAKIVKHFIRCTETDGKQSCKTIDMPAGKPAAGAKTGKTATQMRVTVDCDGAKGAQNCTTTTTTDDVAGGKADAGKTGTREEHMTILADDVAGHGIEFHGISAGKGPLLSWHAKPEPAWRKAVSGALAALSLMLLLAALYNLERLLAAVERASLFSSLAVQRLQWVGVALLATAVLPHFDLPAVIDSAVTALTTGLEPWPAPVQFSLAFNVVLLVASLFLILMARIVEEGVWLHDEIRGTV